ncbi:hypothetical protein [Streptomyces sp. NPDC087294]|uniref:hypothetical protein n=1 Tax=Streptomyces sp. NPDC087294 TaxID=3365777 RepID=UPI00380BE096
MYEYFRTTAATATAAAAAATKSAGHVLRGPSAAPGRARGTAAAQVILGARAARAARAKAVATTGTATAAGPAATAGPHHGLGALPADAHGTRA